LASKTYPRLPYPPLQGDQTAMQPTERLSTVSRRDFLLLCSAAAATPILVGCGGGGGSAEQSDFFNSRNVVLKPNVVVLPADGTVTLSSVTDTSMTLTGALPQFRAGDVIVSGEGPGFMRRVTAATLVGSSIVLVTEGASLTDVFESATVSFRRTLNATDAGTDQVRDGVEVTTEGRSRAATSSFFVKIPKTFVGAEESSDVTKPAPNTKLSAGVEVEAQGAVSLLLDGEFEIVSGGIKKIEIRLACGWSGSYKAALKGRLEYKREVPYFTRIFTPIPLGAVGPVPIVLLPVLSLQLAAKMTIASGWEINGNGKASYSLSCRLVPPTPTFDPVLADLSGSANGTASGDFRGLSFFASVQAEFTPFQVEVATSFNAIVGPTFKVDLPAGLAELKAFPNATDPRFAQADATIDLAFRGKIGAKAGLLNIKEFPLFETTVADIRVPIYKETFKPGTSAIGVN
jgi:hypothetical protein